MKIVFTNCMRRTAAALVLAAYSVALALGSLTPISRQSALAGGSVHRMVNNLLHVPAYAGLACLWAVAVGAFRPRVAFGRDYVLAAGATLAYGALMELVQTFVPGRWCSLSDFLLDVAGVALAAPLVWAWCRRAVARAGQPAA